MKRTLRIVAQVSAAVLCLLLAGPGTRLHATNLTGTFRHPDGSPVNGKLVFLLSQPARLADGSAQVVPMVKIFAVTNGQLEPGAFLFGNDALLPSGTHYVVRLVDNSNNLLFEQKWSIQGTDLDLGTLTPTTVGVVLPDPLVKNTTLEQSVAGPVTFNSGLTAFSLILHGDLHPGSPETFSLGNQANPWREVVTAQLRNKGPRPWVDVRAFGARGDGVNDDTQAITDAITFAAQNGGAVYFPPGEPTASDPAYVITSTIDVAAIMAAANSNSLHFVGGSNIGRNIASFSRPPRAHIRMRHISGPAISMNMAGADRSVTFENLQFQANTPGQGRQGIIYQGGSFLSFVNSCVYTTYDAALSDRDNAAVIIENTLWVKFDTGCYGVDGSPGHRRPIILGGRTIAGAGTALVGLVNMRNVTIVGGGILYHQAVNMAGSAGSYVFEEVVTESASVPLLELTKDAGVAGYRLGPLYFVNSLLADVVGGATPALIRVTADNSIVNGVFLFNSTGVGRAIELAGTGTFAEQVSAWGLINSRVPVTKSNQDLGGGFVAQTKEGLDIGALTSASGSDQANRLVNEIPVTDANLRLFRSAEPSSAFTLLLEDDGAQVAWGKGAGWRGWDAAIKRTTDIALDFQFPEINSPAAPAATPATGGTVAPGTYYYRVEAKGALTGQWASAGPETQVTVGSSDNAVSLSWSAVTGATAYRVFRSPTSMKTQPGFADGYMKEVTTASVTDDGSWGGGTLQRRNSSVQTRHRLGRTSLALNNPTALGAYALFVQNEGTSQTPMRITAVSGTAADLFQIERLGASANPVLRFMNNDNLRIRGDYDWVSGTAGFSGVLEHNNSANRSYIFPDFTGKVAVTASFSAILDFSSISAQTCAEQTVTVSGAAVNDPVAPSWPATLEAGLVGVMYVSATDAVKVRLCNLTAATVDPASQTFAGRVVK